MRKPTQGVKLNDVAVAAGVSRTTASYVLTGNGEFRGVAPATIQKVKRVARELRYVPNLAARNLRMNRSGLFGVLISGFQIGWAHQLEIGIQRALQSSDYLPVFTPHHGNAEKARERYENLLQHQVDGLLIHAPNQGNLEFYRDRTPSRPPAVFMTDLYPELIPVADCVLFDGYPAAIQVTSRLLDMGCRRLAAIHSDSCWTMQPRRYEGFITALRGAGLSLDPALDLHFRFSTRSEKEFTSDIESWAAQVMSHPDQAPDGVFCEHDSVAITLMNAFCRMGRTSPGNTPKVVSIGDLPVRDECGRGITSMGEPISDIGEKAVKLLFKRIENPNDPPEKIIISDSLIHVRESA